MPASVSNAIANLVFIAVLSNGFRRRQGRENRAVPAANLPIPWLRKARKGYAISLTGRDRFFNPSCAKLGL
jgi:hypothetical protein